MKPKGRTKAQVFSRLEQQMSLILFSYKLSKIKGVTKKIPFLKYFFAISMLKWPWNLKIPVPTPHNTPIIVWGTEFLKRSF